MNNARLARAHSVSIEGVVGLLVDIDVHITQGLPGMYMVGLGDTAVQESKHRIRSAVTNCGLGWPRTKIVVSLSPADIPKHGSRLDLGITLAIQVAMSGDLDAAERLRGALVVGEIALDGTVRPVVGALPAILAARDHGLGTVIVPRANAEEVAALVGTELADDPLVLGVTDLSEAMGWLFGSGVLQRISDCVGAPRTETVAPDFRDIVGQPEAKAAAEVAAAGGHHMMLVGPPGSGKSMIAERMSGILPDLDPAARLETAVVHSIAGVRPPGGYRPPFVAPHYSVTRAGLLGGGAGRPRPGAVSLAHHGVLFLDEAGEIPAGVLDSLRVALETGEVRFMRSHRDVVFPAQIQLVLATNPCRCGAEEPARCRCGSRDRARYLANISAPLRDRIGLIVATRGRSLVINEDSAEDSATVAERVVVARDRARCRWRRAGFAWRNNADAVPRVLRRDYPADETGMAMLSALLAAGDITQRGIDRSLRVAWTLSDLEEATRPGLDHVARAIDLHDGAEAMTVME